MARKTSAVAPFAVTRGRILRVMRAFKAIDGTEIRSGTRVKLMRLMPNGTIKVVTHDDTYGGGKSRIHGETSPLNLKVTYRGRPSLTRVVTVDDEAAVA